MLVATGRFNHAVVKAVLKEVSDELLQDKEYDPENDTAFIKSVGDEIQTRLQNSKRCCLLEL